MSPYIAKGAVFQEPKGPTNTSQFDLSSISSTVKTLFSLPNFLTKRDAWAGSFEELLLDEPRDDTPLHLPLAPGQQSPHSVTCGEFRPGWACRPKTKNDACDEHERNGVRCVVRGAAQGWLLLVRSRGRRVRMGGR